MFERAVSKENSQGKVVLVDFYAEYVSLLLSFSPLLESVLNGMERIYSWCGPCKMLSPILEKLTASENAQNVKTGSGRALDLVTVNTDDQGSLAMTYGVRLNLL